jgi:hypothetical protein
MLGKKRTYRCNLEGQSLKTFLDSWFEKHPTLGAEAWEDGYVLKKEWTENHLLLRERLHNKAFSPLYELQYADQQLKVEVRLSYHSYLIFLFPLVLLALAWVKELASGFYVLAIGGILVLLLVMFWVVSDGEKKICSEIKRELDEKGRVWE